MNHNKLINIKVLSVIPSTGGCALFLGTEEKKFVIYVDHLVGIAISSLLEEFDSERPMTHHLTSNIIKVLGAKLNKVIINDFNDGVYFARLQLTRNVDDNKIINSSKEIFEIDARPSDSIALALSDNIPICITKKVYNDSEDKTDLFEKLSIN